MNNEFERMWNNGLEVISQQLPGRAKENHKTPLVRIGNLFWYLSQGLYRCEAGVLHT
jgi:hypothetical protein